MYIVQRITQIHVTFELCQVLWGKGLLLGGPRAGVLSSWRAGRGRMVYWGKKSPGRWLAYVKVMWRVDFNIEESEDQGAQCGEHSRSGLAWGEGLIRTTGLPPLSEEQWEVIEVFYLWEWYDQIYALQRSSWLQCVNSTSFKIGHNVTALLLLLESNNF